ncbi:uncharacterized protein LOC124118465 [Haliotis rufescens]|uniref:uncharacterized protein LOC124118465 n=1 Tax=Haliotis rufescens TaxID=6454 RepID=UPI001EAFF77D|nr:uncharacterized protein LOC124118465 [Haliotis rufescens]
MAGERTNLLLHGLGTLIIATATITLMVAVFTDSWIQSPVEGSGFQKAGLWKICLVNYVIHRNVQTPKGLVGCYSFADPIFYDVQDWIHPIWLKAVKGMLVMSLFLNVFNLFSSAFYLVQGRAQLLIPITVLGSVSTVMISCGTSLYRYSSNDPYWLPLPDSNQLDWSYYTSVATIFIMMIGSSMHGIQALLLCCSRERSMRKH